MEVSLIDIMGSDLTVVNAARVSFNKESNYEIEGDIHGDWNFKLADEDIRLIKYLARHNHWTPFSHPQITLRIKAPIFVARQLFKHKVGFTENEISRRYVDDEPEFFFPDVWRSRPTNGAKQGSGKEEVEVPTAAYREFYAQALGLYNEAIDLGVAPEQARMLLPQSMYTEWYWTASLSAYARMCKQRLDSHAQAETREIAQKISDIISEAFPVSWSVLINKENNDKSV